jgi:SAM-dependent methyltransferase
LNCGSLTVGPFDRLHKGRAERRVHDRRYLREMGGARGENAAEWDPRHFYDRQEQLSGAYSGEVSEHHRLKAALVEAHCGRERRVLELGAGGGQMAVATADLGFDVVAVELVPRLAEHARALAAASGRSGIAVVEGDFYEVAVEGPFGAVCYWDGFGIGTDRDQQALLRRIRRWLADDGRALIDVHTPWYWAAAAGREMIIDRVHRRYDFDEPTQTMVDLWWPEGAPDEKVGQHLRCYPPDDLSLLLDSVGLSLETIEPGGAYDYDTAMFHPRVPVEEAMAYTAIISRAEG